MLRERLDERAERGHRDAGAEEVLRAGDARAAHAEREALERVGVGRDRRDRVRDLVAAEDERVVRLIERERRAAVEADAERVGALQLEVHDDRLDEDLPARLVEAIDDGAERGVVAERRRDDDRVGRLVGGDLHAALEDARRPARRRCGAGRRAAAAAAGAGALRAGDDVGERLRELRRVRVLERQDVDLALARLRHVDALDELEDAQVRALGRDDDERVRAIVGDDLRDVEIAADRRRRRAVVEPPPAFGAEGAPPPPPLLMSKSSLMRFSTSLADA